MSPIAGCCDLTESHSLSVYTNSLAFGIVYMYVTTYGGNPSYNQLDSLTDTAPYLLTVNPCTFIEQYSSETL